MMNWLSAWQSAWKIAIVSLILVIGYAAIKYSLPYTKDWLSQKTRGQRNKNKHQKTKRTDTSMVVWKRKRTLADFMRGWFRFRKAIVPTTRDSDSKDDVGDSESEKNKRNVWGWLIGGILLICFVLLIIFRATFAPMLDLDIPVWLWWVAGVLVSIIFLLISLVVLLTVWNIYQKPHAEHKGFKNIFKMNSGSKIRISWSRLSTIMHVAVLFVICNAAFYWFWSPEMWLDGYSHKVFLITQLTGLILATLWSFNAQKGKVLIVPTFLFVCICLLLAFLFSFNKPGEIFERSEDASVNTTTNPEALKTKAQPKKWVLYGASDPVEVRNLRVDELAGTISYEIWSRYGRGKIGEASATKKPESTTYFGTYSRNFPDSTGVIEISSDSARAHHYFGQEREAGKEWSYFEIRPWS